MNISFSSPITIGIFGPSQVGKTSLLHKLLIHSEQVFTENPSFILYCYNIELFIFLTLKEEFGDCVSFNQGLPSNDLIQELKRGRDNHGIIVLNDLMLGVNNNSASVSLFTVGSHHLNITVFF